MEEVYENNVKNGTLNTLLTLVSKIEPEDEKGNFGSCGPSRDDVPSVSDALSTNSDDNRKLLHLVTPGDVLFQLKEVKIVLRRLSNQELKHFKNENEPEDYNDVIKNFKPPKVEDQNITKDQDSSRSECGSVSYDPFKSLSDLGLTTRRSSRNRKSKESTQKKTTGKEKVTSNSSSQCTVNNQQEFKSPEQKTGRLKQNIPPPSIGQKDADIEQVAIGIAENKELECTAQHNGVLCQCSICKTIFNSASSSSCDSQSNATKPASDKPPYYCLSCDRYYKRHIYLIKHLKSHSEIKLFPCDICARGFTQEKTMVNHKLRVHFLIKSKITCNFCNQIFNNKTTLEYHKKKVHGNANKIAATKFTCKFCGKHFSKNHSLISHCHRVHTKKKQFQCAYCNVVFFEKSYLIQHIKKLHLPEEILNCELCGHSVRTNNLFYHMKNKHSTQEYCCEVCGKIFKTKIARLSHTAVHSDERPFICQTCGKSFKRYVNLKQHQYTHSDSRPHVCDICGMKFRLRTHVKQHMAIHGLLRNHKCPICEKTFAKKGELKPHLLTHQ